MEAVKGSYNYRYCFLHGRRIFAVPTSKRMVVVRPASKIKIVCMITAA
jgi:hypothetical protein